MKTFRPIPPAPFDVKHPLCDIVAAVLFEMREGSDLSRLDLAAGTNVSDEMIRLVETRVCVPRLDRAIRLAEGLGLPLSATMRAAELRLRGK